MRHGILGGSWTRNREISGKTGEMQTGCVDLGIVLNQCAFPGFDDCTTLTGVHLSGRGSVKSLRDSSYNF